MARKSKTKRKSSLKISKKEYNSTMKKLKDRGFGAAIFALQKSVRDKKLKIK